MTAAGLTLGCVDSEYARVRDVMLCPPTPRNRIAYLSPKLAVAQHRHLRLSLEELGVRCHLLPQDESLPYQAYTRDSFVPTPWGLLITRMGLAARTPEPLRVEAWSNANGVGIWQKVTHGHIEGGDIVTIRPGLVAIGINSTRTSVEGAVEVGEFYESQGWKVRIMRYGCAYRHLDVVFSILSANAALCCPHALDGADIDWLRAQGIALYTVSATEAQELGCNLFNVGEGVLIAGDKTERVNGMLEAAGYRVRRVSISEFARDKGGVHCLVQALQRDPAKSLGQI